MAHTKVEPKYNVQCLSGHVYVALPGSDLEKKCIEREEAGYLDALILNFSECEACEEDRERREQQYVSMMADWGLDPFGDDL